MSTIQHVDELNETQTLGLALTYGAKEFNRVYSQLHGDHNRKFHARIKAENELRLNDTIRFDGRVLRFTSRFSNKQRVVTASGCSRECDCGGSESAYHYQLYLLCAASGIKPVRAYETIKLAA